MSPKNEKEIEIKLSFKDKNLVIDKLGPGAKFIKTINVHDIYYGFNDTKMKNIHDILRLRIKEGDSELTYKSKVEDSANVWHRTEISTSIGSPESLNKILTNLGIKKLYEYLSQKEYWLSENCEIVFAKFELPAHLEFMEIEGESEDEIRKIVTSLGDSVEEVGEDFFKIFDDVRKKN